MSPHCRLFRQPRTRHGQADHARAVSDEGEYTDTADEEE